MNTPKSIACLASLSDEALLTKTDQLVRIERKISVKLIEHLQEVSRRRLHLKRGFSSLHDYLVRGHGYSSGAAHRRVQASEICEAMPEIKEKIVQGTTSLTQAMQLQGFFEKKPEMPREEKRELVARVEGLSTRETERALAALDPQAPPRDQARAISGELTQITFAADAELFEMLERIRDLTSHQNAKPTYNELLKLMARKVLHQIDPLEKAKRARPQAAVTAPAPGSKEKRAPNAATTYALHQRDQGKCQYQDPKTGRRCESTFLPQREHRDPYALGGPTTLENLEILCHAHNRLRAIERFGEARVGPPRC